MNKTAIKNFAIWARNKLIADVSYDARLIGITEDGIAKPLPQSFGGTQFFDIGTAEPYSISGEAVRQRDKLIEVIQQKEKDTDYKTAYQYVIEEVAYTWFNRLIAIRFMEVNDYLPSHIRVLSSESGKLEPDLVTTPFDAELPFTAEEEAQIFQLKQDNKLDEVFRILFLKQCNALNEILPALFEKTKNYTELLLSLSVIDQDGVVYHLIHDIPEDDFNIERGGQVEIIGWLYQYYNTEPKAAAFAKNGKITKEEIPAVTQLFTPDWIVRYMVENSLGRLWVEGHPDCGLKENWKYYLEEAQQEPEVQAKLAEIRKEYAALNPEDIKLIDPCMGSGHILVYAFDVLMQIYESAGYSQRDAAKSILEHNIYGLDIDDRAYQLAYFAVMMKARQYNRRILNGENSCHVYAIQESNSINRAHLKYFGAGLDDIEKNAAKMQMEGLLDTLTDAKEYGSILNVESYNWDLLRRFVAAEDTDGQISMDSVGVEDTAEQLNRLIDIGETMARKYWVTVTNPPYMSISNGDSMLNEYVRKYYNDNKADLFAVFIERCTNMTQINGYQAMITQHQWMFLSSFECLRKIIKDIEIANLVHLGARAFEEIGGEVVQTATFVFRNAKIDNYRGTYCRLLDASSQTAKEEMFLSGKARYVAMQKDYENIPGNPIAYWISDKQKEAFGKKKLSTYAKCCKGLDTGNNELFLRLWQEVDIHKTTVLNNCGFWVPYNKGGSFRKWYGNNFYLVNWSNDGETLSNFKGSNIRNRSYHFKEGITWSTTSGSAFAGRKSPTGYLFDSKGCMAFSYGGISLEKLLAQMNAVTFNSFLDIITPTLDFNPGPVGNVPIEEVNNNVSEELVIENISASKDDWDSFENSWDFKKHPLLRNVSTISEAFTQWQSECDARFNQLKANDEELNRIFIDIYGLQDELTPDVADKDVTVHRVFDSKDDVPESMKGSNYVRTMRDEIVSLISYAVGCMFGRYSLDVDGLAYAGGEWDASKYKTIIPDSDNIIPICDDEYFDDDITGRFVEFVRKVYGDDTLEENLKFVADALGGKGTPREVIRSYFLNDFYADHLKTYQKRPIYWLFDSGKKNGFKALCYMHRYQRDLLARLRTDYVHEQQERYRTQLAQLGDAIDHASASERVKLTKQQKKFQDQATELQKYEEKVHHLADQNIEIDLDDGVKHNYELFADVLAKIK